MRSILSEIRRKRLYFDGGTGSILQERGLPAGMPPELWNTEKPEQITALHREYLEAGCRILKTNTFGVNCRKYENWKELLRAGIACAKDAAQAYPDAYVALDIGPSGHLLEPLGDLPFDDAVEMYAATVREGTACGVDLILIETMSDLYETKAALLAAKENSDLPVFVTNAYGEDGKLLTGADPTTAAVVLAGLGADAVGLNCSLGPELMLPLVQEIAEATSLPVVCNPNAGLPESENGKTVYRTDEVQFSAAMREIAPYAAVLGGCCGTTPAYLRRTIEETAALPLPSGTAPRRTFVTSGCRRVEIGTDPILIGERINPTGKPKLKEALRQGDIEYLLGEGVRQAEAGVAVLDVNVGLPEIDEADIMCRAVTALQAVVELPLQIDTGDPVALERAMRRYNGKPMVNSVNGKESSLTSVLPIVKKYGGVLIALTMDEGGIPETAQGRADIARRIAERAEEYGIPREDIVVDPLAMAASADPKAPAVTLEAVRLIRAMGLYTSLGVSNISFGLPARDRLNAAFFANALAFGLNCAIMNPFSAPMRDTYYAFRALNGLDPLFADYIRVAADRADTEKTGAPTAEATLHDAVLRGMKKSAADLAAASDADPLTLIENELVPALNRAGQDFEQKKIFLPQLLACADAASAAFSELRKKMPAGENNGRAVILATVRGDIHDIGKNIVRVLLESYGFRVIDLGRDVPPERVLQAVRESGCRLVGLSALMTTTVPAMKETVELLHREVPDSRVIVGGAVLNEEYAAAIGADRYSPQATDTVQFVRQFYGME